MRYMLDTNIASYIVNKRHSEMLTTRMLQTTINQLFISTITEAELLYGAEKLGSARLKERLDDFLDTINICDWNRQAALEYSRLRLSTTKQGLTIDAMDLLISSHAKSEKMILVSNDKILSQLIAYGLQVENWYS